MYRLPGGWEWRWFRRGCCCWGRLVRRLGLRLLLSVSVGLLACWCQGLRLLLSVSVGLLACWCRVLRWQRLRCFCQKRPAMCRPVLPATMLAPRGVRCRPLVVLGAGRTMLAPRGVRCRPLVVLGAGPSWCWVQAVRCWPLVVLGAGRTMLAPRGVGCRPYDAGPSWC